MISLIAFLWTVLLGVTVAEINLNDAPSTELNNVPIEVIHHSGFSFEDERQRIIQQAYDLGGMEFVLMLECENWNWNPNVVGDRGHAFWLCQMNDRYHNIPKEYYGNREFQLEYCYKKRSTGTRFYGPQRKIKGTQCRDYVRNRFTINLY